MCKKWFPHTKNKQKIGDFEMTNFTVEYVIQYLGFIIAAVIYGEFVFFVYYWCTSQNDIYNKICVLAVVAIFFYGACPVGIGMISWAKIRSFDAALDVANLLQVCVHVV